MKKFFLLSLVFSIAAFTLKAQTKNKGLLRISPALYFPNDLDPAPGGTITGAAALSKYFGVGLNFGIIKLEDRKPVIPLGGELIFTNFKSKNITPIVTFGASYPVYNEQKSSASSGFTVNVKGSGKMQFLGSAGIIFPSNKKGHITLMGGYSLLQLSNKIETYTYIPGNPTTKSVTTSDIDIKMFFISLGITLK